MLIRFLSDFDITGGRDCSSAPPPNTLGHRISVFSSSWASRLDELNVLDHGLLPPDGGRHHKVPNGVPRPRCNPLTACMLCAIPHNYLCKYAAYLGRTTVELRECKYLTPSFSTLRYCLPPRPTNHRLIT